VIPGRTLARGLVPLALHAAARELDRAVGVLLHTTLDLPDFVPRALRLVEWREAALTLALWLVLGSAAWWALSGVERRRGAPDWTEAFERAAPPFLALLLRPALTLLAMASLARLPTYPYGFTLPVALTQDWGVAQDVFALAAALALAARVPRLPAPAPGEAFFIAFLAYALMVPAWARSFEGHPGNEPKYLRMALALGHRLSLEVDGVDAPMEELPVEPLLTAAPGALARLGGESWLMLTSLPAAFSKDAIRATRVARQTVRGKDGGVFHVLAPGPSLLLAPWLRLDRELNLAAGTPGRLRATLLAWNALAAALVAALYSLLRAATGRAGLSAALACFFALIPPFLFYSFQFFPEMPGALVLALVFRRLLFDRRLSERALLGMGVLLASLPWLHQKFLPVWFVLAAMALWAAIDQIATLRGLLWLALPQAGSLFLFALYNFAITGSVRPDALFLAWGPAGITTDHVGQGFFGLLLDQRYGILPYTPIYLAAAGGLLMAGSPAAARLRLGLPAALVYYMTVAMADDWHGAVSNLGRYFMPVAPYAVALLAVAIAAARRGMVALALGLGAVSAVNARALWLDPHAANEATRLLARSAIADGAVYLPDLFIKTLADGAPGLLPRIACWLVLASLLGVYGARAAAGRAGASPLRALAGTTLLVLGCGLLLERWPSRQGTARFSNALEVRPGTTAFATGAAAVERGLLLAGNGVVELLVRSRAPLAQLALLAEGQGLVVVPGRAPLIVRPGGEWGALPLEPIAELHGRRGVSETLYRQRIEIHATGPLALRLQGGE
jgi:hypothetical protein